MYTLPILELLQDSHDPPLTPEGVEELEIELGVRFPADYAKFLLQFNGGAFRRHVMFYVPNVTDKWTEGMSVKSFMGVPCDLGDGGSLAWYAETLEDRIPDGMLVVAHCGGVDLILLSVDAKQSDFGTVWFWDGTEEIDGDNIYWVADSFSEFLAMIQYDTFWEEEECEKLPLFQAIERGNLRALEQYLADGGDVEARNAKGQTLLAAAAIYSWPKMVRALLARAADPNARDRKGRTPLHHAATHSIDSVKLLLQAGADAKARDRAGKSVLAEWSYRTDEILRAHGAED